MITSPVALITHSAIAIAAAAGAWTWQANAYTARLATLQTQYAQAQHRAVEIAHADTIRLQKKADDAQAKATIRINRMVADRASLQSAVDGLRGDLAENSANYAKATEQARANYTAAISAVLADVARVAGDISSKADGHVIDIQRLHEQWPE